MVTSIEKPGARLLPSLKEGAPAAEIRWTRALAGLFQREMALGDWALASMIRALAAAPPEGPMSEYQAHVRAVMFHAGILAESHRTGPLVVALAGNLTLDPGGLDDLTAKALLAAPVVAIGWQAADGPRVRVAVSSHRIDLLALAKQKGVKTRGRAGAVDVAAGEAELVLAAALAAHEENDLAL